MSDQVILSHRQAAPLLKAHQQGRRVATTSLDLGISEVEAIIESDHVVLAPGITLSLDIMEEIAQDENACFLVESGKARKIRKFSEHTNLFYSLLPTDSAPTLMVSGIPMHRIKDTNPWFDSQSKLQALGRISGQVLDTCTGLGYTAILAGARAASVITVELDPVVLKLARLNPWSSELFSSPEIRQIVGSVVEEIEGFGGEVFSHIIHDPPTMSLAGDLYSGDFYRELYRVLRPKGRLFHYTGDPNSKLGRNTARGVARRLREVGFTTVKPKDEAFGLVVYKTA
jgi:predicted methyltransferase